MTRKHTIFAIALACALFARPASATSILVNGDFETGNFSGWTPLTQCGTPPPTSCLGTSFGVSTILPHAGSYEATFAGSGDFTIGDNISQTIATEPGQTYSLAFWMTLNDNFGCVGQPRPELCYLNNAQVYWNGARVFSLFASPPRDYTLFGVSLLATDPASTLTFGISNLRGISRLDDITLTAVPEPASILLVAIGISVGALARRRPRKER